MQRIFLVIVSTLILLMSVLASPALASEQVRLMLVERDPWLMVVGSDTPIFVLYESNRAIWKTQIENSFVFFTAELTDEEANRLQTMADALIDLDDYITLTNATDQPYQDIYFRSNDRIVRRTLDGSLRFSQSDLGVRHLAPQAFLDLFDELIDFDASNAEAWLPKYLEVMVWPYEYAPHESIEWPDDWPDLESETTKKRGESYSIYVPNSERSRLREFLGSRKPKGAVLINGRKWAAAVRTPLPHEIPFDQD